MDRTKVKKFWLARSELSDLPRSESAVNFETDKERADKRTEEEVKCVNSQLKVSANDIIIELGSGNGQWVLRFAPIARHITAVEYSERFIQTARKFAADKKINNIDFICCAAEEYIPDVPADVVFISGLLNYLDDEQYKKLLVHISDMVKPVSGRLFLRETVSTLENDYLINDEYSEALGTNYSALYRTKYQIVSDIETHGFNLVKSGAFFEDGSFLNKWAETRLMYFLFEKKQPWVANKF